MFTHPHKKVFRTKTIKKVSDINLKTQNSTTNYSLYSLIGTMAGTVSFTTRGSGTCGDKAGFCVDNFCSSSLIISIILLRSDSYFCFSSLLKWVCLLNTPIDKFNLLFLVVVHNAQWGWGDCWLLRRIRRCAARRNLQIAAKLLLLLLKIRLPLSTTPTSKQWRYLERFLIALH